MIKTGMIGFNIVGIFQDFIQRTKYTAKIPINNAPKNPALTWVFPMGLLAI